jgi:hypothetical protein
MWAKKQQDQALGIPSPPPKATVPRGAKAFQIDIEKLLRKRAGVAGKTPSNFEKIILSAMDPAQAAAQAAAAGLVRPGAPPTGPGYVPPQARGPKTVPGAMPTVPGGGTGPLKQEREPLGTEGGDELAPYTRGPQITDAEYRAKYGVARDVTEGKLVTGAAGGVEILESRNLNHSGRLRKTGKICGHFAMVAYLVRNGVQKHLGIKFKSGYRCYFPSLSENDYHDCVNSESGSYWAIDNGIRKGGIGYVAF